MHFPSAWSVPSLSTVHCWALVPSQGAVCTGVKSAVFAPWTSTHIPSMPVIASVLPEAEPLLVPVDGAEEAEALGLGAGVAEALPLGLAAGAAEVPPPVIAFRFCGGGLLPVLSGAGDWPSGLLPVWTNFQVIPFTTPTLSGANSAKAGWLRSI